MGNKKVLVVDDEKDILELLEYNLSKDGFDVMTALNGIEALKVVKKNSPDLVLLDIMMPNMDGIETCRRIRDTPEGKNCYIIFLTARSEEYSEIAGFAAGADDYIAKPIRPRVLVSRLKAVFRRSQDANSDEEPEIKIHDLIIIPEEHVVFKKKKEIKLPKKEFKILQLLASKPGKVYSREKLLKKIWGSDVHVVDRTVDVHIRKLREKIGKKYIETIKGVGYKFLKD